MVGAKQFAIMRKIIEDKKKNPILKNISMPNWMRGEDSFKSSSGTFLDKFDLRKEEPKLKKKVEKPEMQISDEMVNKLTYQVFQNIQRYLNSDKEEEVHRRHIKIDISI